MVGVTVEVDRATTNANIIYPGDHVDVIMVSTGGEGIGPASRTIVRGVRVLAVGSTVLALGRYGRVNLSRAGEIEQVPAPAGATYTLEVVPVDAERIAVAGSAGKITLAMRALNAPAALDGGGVSVRLPTRLGEVMPLPVTPTPSPPVRILRGAQSDSPSAGT